MAAEKDAVEIRFGGFKTGPPAYSPAEMERGTGYPLRAASEASYAAPDVGKPARHFREGTMVRTIEQTTMRKVYLRVLSIAVVSYFFCYLDRINVGFAALTMNKDLGLDAATFGFAAGVFFWGYFLFE